ncbi:MAG TPA: hypothetical protein ENI82_06480 [Bacteroidetes bacterium]|nr:hypothetical protein [Bacteroidota bacterium]
MENQLWTDEQVYQMTENFSIRDTFFIDQNVLKQEYQFLKYLPQPDFANYCIKMQSFYTSLSDFSNYHQELQNINTIQEWENLLIKYPSVGYEFTTDTALGNNFINKIENREILIFVSDTKNNAELLFVPNTQENYNEFKHLKRLK